MFKNLEIIGEFLKRSDIGFCSDTQTHHQNSGDIIRRLCKRDIFYEGKGLSENADGESVAVTYGGLRRYSAASGHQN